MQHKEADPSIKLNNISYKDLDIGETIGRGSYGTVSRAKWHGIEVAIKEFHLQNLKYDLQKEFEHEAECWQTVNFRT